MAASALRVRGAAVAARRRGNRCADPPASPRTASCADDERTWTATLSDDAGRRHRDDRPGRLARAGLDSSAAWLVVTTDPDSCAARVEHVLRDPDVDLPVELHRATPRASCRRIAAARSTWCRPGAPSRMSLVVVGDSLAAGFVGHRPTSGPSSGARRATGGTATRRRRPVRRTVGPAAGRRCGPSRTSCAVRVRSPTTRRWRRARRQRRDPRRAARRNPTRTRQRRRTDEVIATFVDRARRDGRCVVLTTPPDRPVEASDLGEDLRAPRLGAWVTCCATSRAGTRRRRRRLRRAVACTTTCRPAPPRYETISAP